MNGIEIRTNSITASSLVAAGAVMAAIGGTSVDHQVASVLPPMGASLVAAGLVALIQATAVFGRECLVLGIALVVAGVAAAVIGSDATDVAVGATLPPIGAAIVTGGIAAMVRAAAATEFQSRLGAG